MKSKVRLDDERYARIRMHEAVYCEGKPTDVLAYIVENVVESESPTIFTRIAPSQMYLFENLPKVRLFKSERIATYGDAATEREASVAILTGGSSDLTVAGEVNRVLQFNGIRCTLFGDIGVAGLHRLLDQLEEIKNFDVVVVCAGWDAALASVVGGLIAAPIIAVPISCGYGVANGGATALNSMLASCAQGVSVVNIDNGFGAACSAIRILNSITPA